MTHLLTIIIIIFADQLCKQLATDFFRKNSGSEVKKGIITFRIVKNSGAALGIFEHRKKLLMAVNVILLAALVYFFIDSIRKCKGPIFILSIAFILGGGLSNFIDRVKRKYVVDFFMFNIKHSPVFNIADIFILIGTIMLQAIILFSN